MERHTEDVLAEAANYLYRVCELYEDGDLDPNDHLEVIKRAYMTSDCEDFSWMVHLMTGWPCFTATWPIPGDEQGFHSLNRAPDGRLFDVCGYTDEAVMARKFLGSRSARKKIALREAKPEPASQFDDVNDQGIEEHMVRIASIIRMLPYAPFNTETFRELASRPVPGVDAPLPDDEPE